MRRNLRIKKLVAVMGKMTTSNVSHGGFVSFSGVRGVFRSSYDGGKSRCTTTYIRGYIK